MKAKLTFEVFNCNKFHVLADRGEFMGYTLRIRDLELTSTLSVLLLRMEDLRMVSGFRRDSPCIEIRSRGISVVLDTILSAPASISKRPACSSALLFDDSDSPNFICRVDLVFSNSSNLSSVPCNDLCRHVISSRDSDSLFVNCFSNYKGNSNKMTVKTCRSH